MPIQARTQAPAGMLQLLHDQPRIRVILWSCSPLLQKAAWRYLELGLGPRRDHALWRPGTKPHKGLVYHCFCLLGCVSLQLKELPFLPVPLPYCPCSCVLVEHLGVVLLALGWATVWLAAAAGGLMLLSGFGFRHGRLPLAGSIGAIRLQLVARLTVGLPFPFLALLFALCLCLSLRLCGVFLCLAGFEGMLLLRLDYVRSHGYA